MPKQQYIIAARDDTDKAVKSARRNFAALSKTVKSARGGLAALGGAAVLGGLTAVVSGVSKTSQEVRKLSNISGETVEDIQSIGFAARQFGFDQEKVADILKDTNDKIGDFLATGAGPMKDFFEQIAPAVGVTADQFSALSGKDALQLYVSSLEQANLSQQQMTFYMEALANDSTALIPLFAENGKLLKEQADRAEELGAVMSEIEIKQMEELNKKVRDLGDSFDGFKNKLALVVSGPLTSFFNMMGNFIPTEARRSVEELTEEITTLQEKLAETGGRERGQRTSRLIAELKEERQALIEAEAEAEKRRAARQADIDKMKADEKARVALIAQRAQEEKDAAALAKQAIMDQRDAERELQEEIRKKTALTEKYQDPLITLKSKIDEIRALKLLPDIEDAAIDDLVVKYNEQIDGQKTALTEFAEYSRELSQSVSDQWVFALDSATIGIGDAFASAIVDAESLSDGLENVLKNVTRAVLASLVEIGAKRLALAALEKAGLAKSATAGAATAASLTAAYTPAAMAASIASFGGAAATGSAALSGAMSLAPGIAAAAIGAAKGAGLAGVAHDGLDMVPRTGTYLLERGERVVKKEDNQKLTKALDNGQINQTEVNVNFQISAIDTQSAVDVIVQNENVIVSMIQNAFVENGRRGPLG